MAVEHFAYFAPEAGGIGRCVDAADGIGIYVANNCSILSSARRVCVGRRFAVGFRGCAVMLPFTKVM
jgi:hypothetical protein